MIRDPDDLKAEIKDILVRKRSGIPTNHDEEEVLENALDTIEWLVHRRQHSENALDTIKWLVHRRQHSDG